MMVMADEVVFVVAMVVVIVAEVEVGVDMGVVIHLLHLKILLKIWKALHFNYL